MLVLVLVIGARVDFNGITEPKQPLELGSRSSSAPFVGGVVSSLPASPMLQLGSAGELRLFS
jgi:hypothetical protein